MGKHIPKGGKIRAHANAGSRRSGKRDIEKRKIVKQKIPNLSGAKPTKKR